MNTNRVQIFDTTLRDGEQSPGASLNVGEKRAQAILKQPDLTAPTGFDGGPIKCFNRQEGFDIQVSAK